MDANLAYGNNKWGNFIAVNGLNTSRFLDPPEFVVLHDKGNLEDLFDRLDLQLSSADSLHMNFGYTRSWFQTPNSYDKLQNIGVVRSLRQSCACGRSALADQDLQHRAFVDTHPE